MQIYVDGKKRDAEGVFDDYLDPKSTAVISIDMHRGHLEDSPSGFGRLTAVRHSATMSETQPCWDRPTVPLGTSPPAWPQ